MYLVRQTTKGHIEVRGRLRGLGIVEGDLGDMGAEGSAGAEVGVEEGPFARMVKG